MPERSFENSGRGKKIGQAVLVIPIDLQNYANDYTFLISIHWFKTGCMITMYLRNQGQVLTSTVRKYELREIVLDERQRRKICPQTSNVFPSHCFFWTILIDRSTLSLTVSVQKKLTTYDRLRLLGMEQKNRPNNIEIISVFSKLSTSWMILVPKMVQLEALRPWHQWYCVKLFATFCHLIGMESASDVWGWPTLTFADIS